MVQHFRSERGIPANQLHFIILCAISIGYWPSGTIRTALPKLVYAIQKVGSSSDEFLCSHIVWKKCNLIANLEEPHVIGKGWKIEKLVFLDSHSKWLITILFFPFIFYVLKMIGSTIYTLMFCSVFYWICTQLGNLNLWKKTSMPLRAHAEMSFLWKRENTVPVWLSFLYLSSLSKMKTFCQKVCC